LLHSLVHELRFLCVVSGRWRYGMPCGHTPACSGMPCQQGTHELLLPYVVCAFGTPGAQQLCDVVCIWVNWSLFRAPQHIWSVGWVCAGGPQACPTPRQIHAAGVHSLRSCVLCGCVLWQTRRGSEACCFLHSTSGWYCVVLLQGRDSTIGAFRTRRSTDCYLLSAARVQL
jgi:hypothetical protein